MIRCLDFAKWVLMSYLTTYNQIILGRFQSLLQYNCSSHLELTEIMIWIISKHLTNDTMNMQQDYTDLPIPV